MSYRISLAVLALIMILITGCGSTLNEPDSIKSDSPLESVMPAEKPAFIIEPNLFHPDQFVYLGAFRLPDDAERPLAFAWGGEAITFNPSGDTEGMDDGFPGSLFVMGHNRMPFGELPDGNRIAEITIPVPIISKSVDQLSQAEFIQPLTDALDGHFTTLDEIPRVGMQYLDTEITGPLIHIAFGQHFHDSDNNTMVASHAWINPVLSSPDLKGPWFIGDQSLYSVNDYLFEIPVEWAEQYAGGKVLATGRFRDGGWSGMGPALFAYQPWIGDSGTPPSTDTKLDETVLLLYQSSVNTDKIEQCLQDYQHPDEWAGGAWLTAGEEKMAVIFVGTKATGEKYWYGFLNPDNPRSPCVESEYLGQFTLCRLADGSPCPDEGSAICDNHSSNRGWWSTSFNARFILYNPADLARVATGQMEPWEPQPYAFLDIDEHLFLNPSGIEPELLGTGLQRRYRIGDMAYDRDNGLIYVLELFADEARPVVHVWQIQ